MFTGIGIFLSSTILVSIVAKCFFKKDFWENRYLILLIIGCVTLVATLTTNFAIRNKLDTKFVVIKQFPIDLVNFNDSLVDNNFYTKNNKMKMDLHLNEKDSVFISSHYLFYFGGSDSLRIGFSANNELSYNNCYRSYIASSNSDTIAYYAKIKQVYNIENNRWITKLSLPRIKTFECLFLPPTEFAAISDTLIRKISINLL